MVFTSVLKIDLNPKNVLMNHVVAAGLRVLEQLSINPHLL